MGSIVLNIIFKITSLNNSNLINKDLQINISYFFEFEKKFIHK